MAEERPPETLTEGPVESGADSPDFEEKGPNRRCIVTGRVLPVEQMIRFVVGPDGVVVPDIEARLPGRGLWLSAGWNMVNTAVAKNLFAKSFRRKVVAPADLAETIAGLLLRRCLERIGLARRAGQAITGFEKVRGELKAGRGAVLLAAADGAADGRDKIRALAPALPLVAVLSSEELGAAFGRSHAVHALLTAGRLADGLKIDATRLAGMRRIEPGCNDV
ncbi:RNA-binding protein [Telmatospirillum siberiense]|uniref:YlxR domain-containing protein n=1 Tax=Telmatospirillum siberiense TaxID=382514 RepID=A0A2N3PSE8_9PROT|nr:RNA-binding protein [Telmatospirillum siberiense]PKU23333.1 hypothetical protein CWS72_17015 [Telmatospirillum siberiense]